VKGAGRGALDDARLAGPLGQAAVEVVGMLPLLAVAGVAVLQLLAAGAAHEYAGHAAEAGAIALGDGRDPERAARGALPGWSRSRVDVAVRDRRVSVRVHPPAVVRAVSDLLAADASANAGPRS
jgi:hypothetical protein